MDFLLYTLAFFFVISFSTNVLSFLYGILVPEHNHHKRQEKFLRKQAIHFAVHTLLLLPLFVVLLLPSFLLFFVQLGISQNTLFSIYAFFSTCLGLFVGCVLLRVIYIGFDYVTGQ